MAAENFDLSLERMLRSEGGFVDHPKDPGGVTNLGVTKRVWEDFTGTKVTVDEMRALTVEDVTELYRTNYWNLIRGNDLPHGLDYAVFDYAVNSGGGRAGRHIQEVVGTTVDGGIGPNTIQAINDFCEEYGVLECVDRLLSKRIEFLKGLDHWETFGKGWTKRVNHVWRDCEVMINPDDQKKTGHQ